MVNALAVDDVAGALQDDAGDGNGSADVGSGRRRRPARRSAEGHRVHRRRRAERA